MRRSTQTLVLLLSFLSASSLAAAQVCPGKSYNFGAQLRTVGVAHLDNDGAPDIVTGTIVGMGVHKGKVGANGDFTNAGLFMSASFADYMVLGDFNNDGTTDAVSSGVAPLVFYWQGNGVGGFLNPVGSAAGAAVQGIDACDFNRDGKLDVVTINTASSTAAILMGSGTGTFANPVSYSLNSVQLPRAVACADINLDGMPDVVTANDNGVGYFPGTAGGTLGSPQFPGVTSNNTGISLGDMDHNGFLDAVISTTSLNLVTVLGGSPAGMSIIGFTNLPGGTSSTVVADLNQDSHLDIAATLSTGSTLVWVAGNGNATFGAAVSMPIAGLGPVDLAAADLNLDGRVDVLSANNVSGSVSVFLGNVVDNGQLNFPVMNSYSFSTSTVHTAITAGDFYPDGTMDLFIGTNSGPATIFSNIGNGTFLYSFTSINQPGYATQMVSGDFNNDGTTDVAVSIAGGVAGLGMTYLVNQGSFSPQTLVGGNYCTSLAAGDFNLDGRLDVAINESSMAKTHVCLNGGGMTMVPGSGMAVGTQPVAIAADDLNHDGKPDFAVACYQSSDVWVFYSTGSGFGAPQTFAAPQYPLDIQIADFNRDSHPDILTAVTLNSSIAVFIGNGAGTFGAPGLTTAPSALGCTKGLIEDFNLDGKPDVAALSACGNSTILLGNAVGGFIPDTLLQNVCFVVDGVAADFNRDGLPDVAQVTTYLAFPSPFTVHLSAPPASNKDHFSATNNIPAEAELIYASTGDLDQDGDADLVTTEFTTNSVSTRSNAGACFGLPTAISVGSLPRSSAIGDVNLDGILDLVSPSQATSAISVRKGIGGGSFGPLFTYVTGGSPFHAAIGDIDQDGWPDVVTANFGTDTISLLFNSTTGTFAPPVNLGAGPQPDYVVLGEFDGNGLPDIAIGLYGSADMQIFLAIGGGFYQIPTIYYLPPGSRSTGLDVGDLDQNGTLDIATANFSSNTVTTMFGFGNGGFNWSSLPAGAGPFSVSITDLNADGLVDMAATNNSGDDLSLIYSLGGGSFAPEQRHLIGHGPRNITIADINVDGRPDMAIPMYQGQCVSLLTNAMVTPVSMSSYGTGTQGCRGRIVMNANKAPKVNTSDFTFNCTGAPRNTLGVGLVTDVPDYVGSDPFGLFVVMHLDFINMTEFYYFDLYMDSWGVGIGPAPIPNDTNLIGNPYYVQALAFEALADGAACSTSAYKAVASRGIQLVIQP